MTYQENTITRFCAQAERTDGDPAYRRQLWFDLAKKHLHLMLRSYGRGDPVDRRLEAQARKDQTVRLELDSMRMVLVLLVTLVLQTGCASNGVLAQHTPVPGSNIYCLNTKSTQEFWDNLKASSLSYGPFTRRAIAGDSLICDLTRFYNYTVSWQTKDGRSEQFEFNFEKIMRKFQDERPEVNTLTRHSSQPDLVVEYQVNQIEIYYRVSQYQPGGMEVRNGLHILTKPAITTKFPLLTIPLSQAVAELKPQ